MIYTASSGPAYYTAESLAEHRSVIKGYADAPGRRRAEFDLMKRASDEPDAKEPFFVVYYGSAAVLTTRDGSISFIERFKKRQGDKSAAVVAPELENSELPAVAHLDDYDNLLLPVASGVPSGAVPMNFLSPRNNVHVACGTCVIAAPGNVGKSPLAQALASSDPAGDKFAMIRAGEAIAGYTNSHRRLAHDLAHGIYHCENIVLDSIKDLLADSGGNATSGGISRAALTSISDWGALAAMAGCTIYIPLNPSGGANLNDMMAEIARSNATMAIWHESARWHWLARRGEGLMRASGDFDVLKTAVGGNIEPSDAPKSKAVGYHLGAVGSSALHSLIDRASSY